MTRTILAIVFALASVSPTFAFDITACGQAVPNQGTGVLQADLDCSADAADHAVTLGEDSTLDMNGHSIIGRHIAVHCGSDAHTRGCTVMGNGEISGGNYGITGAGKRMILSDLYLHDLALQGIQGGRRLFLSNVTVLRSVNGIIGYGAVLATNVTSSENEYAGLSGRGVKGSDITANLNGYSGVTCKKCAIERLTANDNGETDVPVGAGGGIQGIKVKLTDSTLTGNVVDGVPVDIDTYAFPRLTNTTCDHSRNRNDPSSSWGVCASD